MDGKFSAKRGDYFLLFQPYERRILRVVGVCLRRRFSVRRDGKMGREEQIEEREVLDSIFPDEITGQCPSPRSVGKDC